MSGPPYLCHTCSEDLTDAVTLEREQSLDVLRVWRARSAARKPTWSVRVFCSKEHENVFSGDGDD